MGEPEGKPGHFPSEASRMLEAALEQMDGIIQGAKYELPNYFDSFSIQVRVQMVRFGTMCNAEEQEQRMTHCTFEIVSTEEGTFNF